MRRQDSMISRKMLNDAALGLLVSVIVFLFAVFTSSIMYAIPLLIIAIVPLSISSTGAAGRIVSSLSLAIPFFILDYIAGPEKPSAWFIFYTTAVIILLSAAVGSFYTKSQRERQVLEENSQQERSLSDLSAKLLTAATAEELYSLTLKSIYDVVNCPVILFTKDAHGKIKRSMSLPEGIILFPDEGAVELCMDRGELTGRSTEYCPNSSLTCIPVKAKENTLAAVGLLIGPGVKLSESQLRISQVLLMRSGIAMERLSYMERERQILIEKELEHMRSDFMRSISHDFRTPLTGILGASSTLEQTDVDISEKDRNKLVHSINEEASWLLRMVENLLSVTRFGEKGPQIKKTPEPVEEVLQEVLEKTHKRYPGTVLRIKSPDDFLLVPMDPTLIIQVLMNFIDNAVKYSGAGSPIDLCAAADESSVFFSVRDHGKGLSKNDIDSLFTPTTEHLNDFGHGMGLGLSICRSIISAHGGTISGRNHEEGGAEFTISLPREENTNG